MTMRRFERLGASTFQRRATILTLAAVAMLAALSVALLIPDRLRIDGYADPRSESAEIDATVLTEFEVGRTDIVALFTSASGSFYEETLQTRVALWQRLLSSRDDVVGCQSFASTGSPRFISSDGTRTFIVISLGGEAQDKLSTLPIIRQMLIAEVESAAGLQVSFSGITPLTNAAGGIVNRDLARAELIVVPITAVLLVLIYGSLVSAALPVVLGVLSILLSLAALKLLSLGFDLNNFAVNVITLLGLGLSIDYSLFILSRFREELSNGDVEAAVIRTVASTGKAVVFSGLTVAVSLLGLLVFERPMMDSIAIGGVVVVLVAVVLSVTILPAMLSILGRRVDRLRVRKLAASKVATTSGPWYWLARRVLAHPWPVAIVVSSGLVLLALPIMRFEGGLPDHRVLPANHSVRTASTILNDEFLPFQASPHQIIVAMPSALLTPQSLEVLEGLSKSIAQIDGISTVDGLFSFGDATAIERVLANIGDAPSARGTPKMGIQTVMASFVSGDQVRFVAYSDAEFNARRSTRQVDRLRTLALPDGWTLRVGGTAANLVDLKNVLWRRSPWMLLVVAVVMFIVLLLAFDSITLPIKAMLMNSMALTASFGAMVWVFQDGRFEEILGYESLGFSDATQPLLMFAIMFGLSMDYEVLILCRVKEEYDRSGNNTEAVARGLAATGRLITSAALILVVVMGAMATSEILFLKTLGFGMALAIVLDATIVRALLVPAIMGLMGRWNWYSPAWLRSMLGRVRVGGAR